MEVAEARGHDQPGLGSGLLCSALLAMCEAAQALFMHEVPVHVNATMEEEVGQADDRRSSNVMSSGCGEPERKSTQTCIG